MKIKPIIYLLLAFFLFIGGCGDRKLPEEKSASELMALGQERFERRDYALAILLFQRVKDWYPFSELVTTAELQIAEAHYKLKEYDEAAEAYQEFVNLHIYRTTFDTKRFFALQTALGLFNCCFLGKTIVDFFKILRTFFGILLRHNLPGDLGSFFGW